METFLRGVALVLVGVILSIIVSRQNKDLGVLLSIGVCTMTCISAAVYLENLTDFLEHILILSDINREYLSILLKCTGIGLLSELAGLICIDAGESSMSKALQLLANGAILFLSLPLLEKLIELLEEVLGHT